MDFSKIKEITKNEPNFRLKQIQEAVFTNLIEDWNQATGLPKALREKLIKVCPLDIKAELSKSSDENSIKVLLELSDGKFIEAVLMKHAGGRNTVCVSSLVGCPMGCTFCATGDMGMYRKLTADEMIIQVLFFARYLKKYKKRVSSVVFMGMGEPFLNYKAVMEAVHIMQSPQGFGIGARHISISTCGLFYGIRKLAQEELALNLAISLHASNDTIRKKLMPIAKTYAIKDLLKEIDNYIAKTKRKVMFEYLMIDKINDQDRHAVELGRLLNGKLCMVNLIQYNPTGKYKASPYKQMLRFKNILEQNGVSATVRYKFGRDIKAACGQLAIRKK